MPLYFRYILPVCFVVFSSAVFALDNWWQSVLSEQPYPNIQNAVESGGNWYHCETDLSGSDSSAKALCLDDFQYYHQHLYGEVTLNNDIAHFVFLSQYEWQSWNDLILNLRKDGFILRRVQFNDAEYDVANSLKQKSTEAVDKEVILMMNRYPPEARQTTEWVRPNEFDSISPSLKVMLESDGDIIKMHVTRF